LTLLYMFHPVSADPHRQQLGSTPTGGSLFGRVNAGWPNSCAPPRVVITPAEKYI
jgi:hypothetical protein